MIDINLVNINEHEIFELLRSLFPKGMEDNSITFTANGDYLILEGRDFKEVLEIKGRKLNTMDIKRWIYKSALLRYEKNSPWGILTGIRPTKLAIKTMEKNSLEETRKILREDYLISNEKIDLMLGIIEIEKKHIFPMDRERYSLYIHIPFCPSRCSYCSFSTIVDRNNKYKTSYTDALIKEIKLLSEYYHSNPHTIYIGGGTPTSLSQVDLERLLNCVEDNFNTDCEFTVECGRPDTINRDVLNLLKNHGVNRISINPQSMVENTLKTIGRNHSLSSIYTTYEVARDVKFDTINMDLIVGLDGEDYKDMYHSLNEVVKLNPENITIHCLSLKNGAKLMEKGFVPDDDFEFSESYRNLLLENNYMPYYMYRQKRILNNFENIGYTKPGFECIYNIAMMEERESILGVGMGATSKFYFPEEDRIETIANFRNLKDYMENTSRFKKKIEMKVKS